MIGIRRPQAAKARPPDLFGGDRQGRRRAGNRVAVTAAVLFELAPGGMLLFHSMLQHGTPANTSVLRRRALQFVYVPATAGRITPAERLAVFGSEGKNVVCSLEC